MKALGTGLVGDVDLVSHLAHRLVHQFELLLKRLGELEGGGEVVYASIDGAVVKQFVYPCKKVDGVFNNSRIPGAVNQVRIGPRIVRTNGSKTRLNVRTGGTGGESA